MGRRTKTARSAEFKAKVALAALQDDKTLQQLGRIYDVHPSLIHQWRKQLLLGAAGVFESNDARPDAAAQQAREAELFEQIGRLNMELDWLKKKVAGLE